MIPKMNFSLHDIEELISANYGVQGTLKSLPGEIDLNFLLTTTKGQKYTFKVANIKEKKENLEFQNSILNHLAAKDMGLEIPTVIPSPSGDDITLSRDKDGHDRFIRLLTWVEGRPLATVNPHSPEMLYKVGELCGKLAKSLKDFNNPSANRFIKWDLAQLSWIKPHLHKVNDERKQQLLNYFYELNELAVKPVENRLRKSVIYNDANDYNILVSHDALDPIVPGVIDFGDAVYSHTINELAIAMAYALMHKPDPLQAAGHMVRGYHEIYPLHDEELKVLFPLIATRLIISVICSQLNREEEPDNVYLQISDIAAWNLLEKLRAIPPSLAYYTFRSECGLAPCPTQKIFTDWAKTAVCAPIVKCDSVSNQYWLDLSMSSLELGSQSEVLNGKSLQHNIEEAIHNSEKSIGIGRYNEARPFYTSAAFEHGGNEGPEWRTIHIGLDLFAKAYTPVFTPLDGEVVSTIDNEGDRNYGPTVILKHEVLPELTFYTLYGHLSRNSLTSLNPGTQLKAGDQVGSLGGIAENGGWSPHLHFQVILDLLDSNGDYNGVVLPSQRTVWTSLCPDPWWLIGNSPSPAEGAADEQKLMEFRKVHLGKNLSLSYRNPLHIVRGHRQYVFDHTGRKFLDTVNNVAHVGHEHPRVIVAGQRQMAVLNTNTRYLHKNIIHFTEALMATIPAPLEVAYIVNSGSEANELALRIARTYTGQKDMVVVEAGYHGNTNACVEVSSYKFDGKGGKGAPEHIQVVPIPDVYRGLYQNSKTAGREYADYIKSAINKVKGNGRNIAGFICESVLSCGGQIVLPEGYLKEAYNHIHATGGVCIADEVQIGCGRSGSHFWAFETQGVVPDILTIGKPIGNGHPLGVVVTSRKLADAFANGMEYFNTFGGNPVSCAIGLEVLNTIREEKLQQNAEDIGNYLKNGLLALMEKFPIIGDVRGVGLFLGLELIKNNGKEPATKEAAYLANRMRELGVLMSTDGPYENVMKIKPPMVFNQSDSDFLLKTLERVLKEDYLQNGYN